MQRKKSLILTLVSVLLLSLCLPLPAAPIQTLVGPIYVYSAGDLNNVRNNLTAQYIQMADIDLSGSPWSDGTGWVPIGNDIAAFTGTYDGNGFNIANLTINQPGVSQQGLFGITVSTANVQLSNISLSNASVTGSSYVGGLVGNALGPVENCSVSGSFSGDSYVGGLVGRSQKPIKDCFAFANVQGTAKVGGLVGAHEYSTMTNCDSEGQVQAEEYAGGLIGHCMGSIVTSHSSADVSGLRYAGGLAGMTDNSEARVTRCGASGTVTSSLAADNESYAGGLIGWSGSPLFDSYALGDVIGAMSVGGLVGYQPSAPVARCIAEGNVTGQNYVGGLIGRIYSSNILGSRAYGAVTGKLFVGGLVGWQNPVTETSTISYCSAFGAVSGEHNVGGLIGENNGSIINCYAKGTVAGLSRTGGLTGSIGGLVQNSQAHGSVSARMQTGGLTGYSTAQSTIRSSHAFGSVDGYQFLGGLVGEANGPILCSSAAGAVTAQADGAMRDFNYVGGLVGISHSACTITSSFAQGAVAGNRYIGGLVGLSSGNIYASYALGNVTGESYIGGLCGQANGSNPIVKDISHCYSTGTVTGSGTNPIVGGLIGEMSKDVLVTSAYYDSTTSGQSDTGRGAPRTTAELVTGVPSTAVFYEWSADLWRFDPSNQYPWHLYNRPQRIPVERISGTNRYLTAVNVSQMGWPECQEGAKKVILAVGTNFPDSLAGVTLALQLNAPILLTGKDTLPPSTKAEIQRLGAEQVIILGGTGAVSEAVADDVRTIPGVSVRRIAGENRYDTARLIAMRSELNYDSIFLASGLDFPDALSAAAYAARRGQPILLTGKTALSDSVKLLLQAKPGIRNILVVGGPGAIADSVLTELSALGYGAERVFGTNRYETSLALAELLWLDESSEVFLATGTNFPDALAGGVLAAKGSGGVLLVRNTAVSVPDPVANFMGARAIRTGLILGGATAVSNELEMDLWQLLTVK